MRKIIFIDETDHDGWLYVAESLEEALEEADYEWARLTTNDKKKRRVFLVGVGNVEKQDGQWGFVELEDGNIDAAIYEVYKDYLKEE